MNKINILRKTGLKKKEARIYLATLELDESTVLPISKKSGIQRTYCYDILDSLIKKGLVSYIEKRGRRRYSATDPSFIKEQINLNKRRFRAILPELKSVYQKAQDKPRVRLIEGHYGIEAIHKEILKEAKKVQIISSTKEWVKEFPDYIEYAKKFIKKDIKIKELSHFQKEIKNYAKYYKKPKQEIKYLSKSIKLENDIIIWNDKVALISYSKELMAVVIESEKTANTHRQLFKVLWKMSK